MTAGTDPGLLSTAPAPPPPAPDRSTPLQALRRGWRVLTSMRTALILLGLLGLAAIPGSVIPQQNINPVSVARFQQQHVVLGRAYQRLQLFHVFSSWWFFAIYALLFVSLVGCVIPRTRLHLRALLRRPPSAPRHLGRLPQSARWETDLPPADAVAQAANVLRRRRFRVSAGEASLGAEKGYLRETGNLLFHVSLILLLAGIGVGKFAGYQGDVLVVDGHSFTNAAGNYNETPEHGALVSLSSLSPFTVKVDDFHAAYQPDGQPAAFAAQVTGTTAGGAVSSHSLQVNHPLTFGHARVYLTDHGYTLDVAIRDPQGKAVFQEEVPCIPLERQDLLSSCIVKAPDTGGTIAQTVTDPATGQRQTVQRALQFGMDITFAPTFALTEQGTIASAFPAANYPVAAVSAYTGDLGLDSGVPQNAYVLDTGNLTPVTLTNKQATVALDGQNHAVPLPQGYTLDISGSGQWVGLHVKDDPGKGLTLVAAVLIIAGLLLSLRIRRRRVWLRATPTASGRTLVEAGGLARTDADDFAREFPRLVTRLAGVIRPARPDRES